MGTDDLFKKRREERKSRKHEYKPINTNSFLIVTEGERTEPLYFKEIQKKIKEKLDGRIDVVENPVIDIYGEGCGTGKLSEIFKQYNLGDGTYHKNYENIYDLVNMYDGVNNAIKNAKRRMEGFIEERDIPSQFDPGTMVYKLVEELKRYLDE